MKNYTGPGDRLDYTPAADVSAGDLVLLGSLPAVAATDIAAGEAGAVLRTGKFRLSVKGHDGTANAAVALYDPLYWDGNPANPLDKNNANTLVGYALGTVAAGATAAIEVLLARK